VLRVALLAAGLALAAAPSAAAWTTLAGGVQNTVVPSLVVTQAGTELAAYDSQTAGTISVSRSQGTAKVVVSGDPVAGRVQLVQQPNGAIQLYFPNAQGRRPADLDRRRRLVDWPDPDAVPHDRPRRERDRAGGRHAALRPGRGPAS